MTEKFNPADGSRETRRQMLAIILMREMQAATSEEDLRERLLREIPAEEARTHAVQRLGAPSDEALALAYLRRCAQKSVEFVSQNFPLGPVDSKSHVDGLRHIMHLCRNSTATDLADAERRAIARNEPSTEEILKLVRTS